MSLKQRKVNTWFVKLPVMMIYLMFFAVQLFFNFDIAQRSALQNYSAITKVVSGHKTAIHQDDSRPTCKTKIRLNKRFQPSTIPVILNGAPEKPLCYAPLKQVALTTSSLYQFNFYSAHTLRGPPVIA
jgi:hypothetical protein